MIAPLLIALTLVVGAPVVTPADAMKHGAGHQVDHKMTFTGPLSKGLGAFHDVLHPLWHDLYPRKDYNGIKARVPELKARAADLTAVNLPPGARAKRAQRDALIKAVGDLDAAKQDDRKFAKAFAKVHDAFEKLALAAGDH
jgi:hypothetical protein